MINEYFDGNLDSPNQEFLFEEIAKNEDLRYDFNQQFAMKLAIGKDTAAFVPRTQTTDALFSSLGIAGASASKFGFLPANKKQIFTGIFSTLATVLIMLWLLPLGYSSSEVNINEIPVVSSVSYDAPNLTIELPEAVVKESSSSKGILNNENINNKSAEKISQLQSRLIASENKNKHIIEENNNLRLALDNKNNETVQNNNQNDFYANEEYNTVFESNFVGKPNNLNTNMGTNYIINNNVAYNPDASIKLEAAIGRYFQNIGNDFIERNNTFSDNLRVSGLYNLSREYSIGLDMRQENFYQEFTDVNELGNKVLYQQQPVVYSGSLLFRYSPEYLEFFKVRPNVDLSVGVTNIGELARIGVGFDYYFLGNTYFYLKSDYTFLSFFHKDINFSSNKVGTHLGLGIEF